MDGGEPAVIYTVLLFIGFFGGAWVYSLYLNRRGGENPE
jgi:heme O synthase-like polyprenyltransferase